MDKYDLSRDATNQDLRDSLKDSKLTVLEYHQGAKKSRKTFNNVYVKGFPKDASFTEEALESLFNSFGPVQSAAIMRDGNGDSKGFGFICFKDPSAAEACVQHVMRSEAAGAADEPGADGSKAEKGVKLSDLYVREAKKK